MNDILKQRIVGAVVLVALAVIFVPMVFNGPDAVKPKATVSFKVPPPPVKQQHKVAPRVAHRKHTPPRVKTPVTKTSTKVAQAKKPAHVIKPRALTPQSWVVQLASFNLKANATALEKQLQDKGYPAYQQKIKGSKGEIVRILIGPEVKRQRAEQLLVKLQQETKMKGIVIPYHPIET